MERGQALQWMRRVAQRRFGFERLTPAQEQAIGHALVGRDTLAVLPTGAGKSAIYQIAGLGIPGPTVVVSPLLALQRDQLAAVARHDLAPAAAINSQVPAGEQQDAIDDLVEGALEFIFLSPEQLQKAEVLEQVRAAQPSLLVIDEAHCIAEWGHDFRPEYQQLGAVAAALGRPTVLALTATASLPVQEEIVRRLGMLRPAVVTGDLDRPNIRLGVELFADERAKQTRLLNLATELPRPMVVYTATRAHAETLAARCGGTGEATVYHAGLTAKQRTAAQDAFMAGHVPIMVATNAFGLGIDKPDIRAVVHYDLPQSLDGYYQEAGRAGRDGEPAEGLLLFDPADVGVRRYFAAGGRVPPERLTHLLILLGQRGGELELREAATALEVRPAALSMAINRLSDAGIVRLSPSREAVWLLRSDVDPAHAATAVQAAQERRQAREQARVEMMRAYAGLRTCRREFLLAYFGQDLQPPCGACDNCLAGAVPVFTGRRPFPVMGAVEHPNWGRGRVMGYIDDDGLLVYFDAAGYKTLSLAVAMEQRVLLPVDGWSTPSR